MASRGQTHIGMRNSICPNAWPNMLDDRLILKHVAAICKGDIHAGSCYLASCNVGVKAPRNTVMLQLMAGVLNSVKGPLAIGGDWDCTREDMRQTGWLKLVRGVIVAPSVPTCGQRTVDFIVVSNGLRHAAPVA